VTPGLKFGILPTPIYGVEVPPARHLAEHTELVQTAQDLGFRFMACGQHFAGSELRYYNPITYLTYLALQAPKMTAVTGIMLLSMTSPVELAENIATMDVVTGGRVVFGVGLGYSDKEFLAQGIDPRQKVRRFEHGLDLIKALWSGEEVNYEGPFWKVTGATPSVLPLQDPCPPIWIGGQAAPAVLRAARMGDAWYAPPFPSHDGLAAMRQLWIDERERLELPTDGDFPVRREVIVADNRAQAIQIAAERSALRYRTYQSWGLQGENTPISDGSAASGIDVESQFILGSPDECVEQIGKLQETLGMTHFMFKSHWQGLPHVEAMKQLELFGTKVLPQLADPAA
jgi:alkanesulfonate monooxygenase SsuD/methylene tetrahydromethanopterin reductase-like flavin-dependent oxidoreductase (luciferase family)